MRFLIELSNNIEHKQIKLAYKSNFTTWEKYTT